MKGTRLSSLTIGVKILVNVDSMTRLESDRIANAGLRKSSQMAERILELPSWLPQAAFTRAGLW